MRYGKLNNTLEFDKRCKEVFLAQENEEYYGIAIEDNGKVCIEMGELGGKKDNYAWLLFSYYPNMSERKEALEYLMGTRNNFND